MTTGVAVWHPESLDVDALFGRYGLRVGEGVLVLGHFVYTGLADDAHCRDAGCVPLRAEYLRKIIGQRCLDAVRQAALKAGYVDRRHSFRVGLCSQAYRILPRYRRARLVQHEITDFKLRHNFSRWREARHREVWQQVQGDSSLVAAPVRRHLWRNLQRVRIDAEIDPGALSHPAYQIAVENLRRGELWFIVDDFGRIHTNVTNLPRTLRPYLSVEGQRLANVDISESQPLFMGMVIAEAVEGTRGESIFRAREIAGQDEQSNGSGGPRALAPRYPIGVTNQENSRATRATTPRPPYDVQTNDVRTNDVQASPACRVVLDRRRLPRDLQHYMRLCESRQLYQTLADRLGLARDEAKKLTMRVFFDDPSHRNAASPVFDELFPTVMEAMRRIKREDYRKLAHLAQRTESAFMFGRVIPHLMRFRPTLFISTIHDAVLTPEGDAEFVRVVMLNEFARLGLSPQVRIEPCSHEAPAAVQESVAAERD